MRVVIFGDGGWATKTLLRLRYAGHDVPAVVLRAQPSDPSLEGMAKALGLRILQPARINTPETVTCVRALGADVHLSIAYNQIFGPEIRATAPWFLNVHAGKLPEYRGRNVINWALINGEREIGLTVHVVDGGIDTGDIVLQRTLPIEWTTTYGDLLDRVVHAVPDLVADCLASIATGQAKPRAQVGRGTYFGCRREGDEWLEWSRPSADIYNKVRGITRPGPGARTLLGDAHVIVWRAWYEPDWPRYRATPGEVVGRERGEGVVVKTGDSTVLLQEIQIGNEPPRVPRWPIGTRLTEFR